MNTTHCPALSHSCLPSCPSVGDRYPCGVERCNYARRILESIHLMRLGARAALAATLTGLARKTVKRIYRECFGRPSPAGQLPFSDAWLLDNDQRLVQVMLIWHLYRRLNQPECSPARILIDVFEVYTQLTRNPLLDLARTAFVIQLFTAGLWNEHRCVFCELTFPAPADSNQSTCPSCRGYFRHRCPHCGLSLSPKGRGVRSKACIRCDSALN